MLLGRHTLSLFERRSAASVGRVGQVAYEAAVWASEVFLAALATSPELTVR